jgi:hypothetical protein
MFCDIGKKTLNFPLNSPCKPYRASHVNQSKSACDQRFNDYKNDCQKLGFSRDSSPGLAGWDRI